MMKATSMFCGRLFLRRLAIVGALAATILMRWLIEPNADTSWLITLSERVLDGQRLYVDVLETNPPASVWLYLPIIWLARFLSLSPEHAVDAVFTLAALGAALSGAALTRGMGMIDSAARTAVLASLLTILLILPVYTFAEREHAALIAATPVLFALARRLQGLGTAATASLAIGLCAGLVVAVKPHFAAALALPGLYVMARERSLSLLASLEFIAAVALVIVYGVCAYLSYPAYFQTVLPLVSTTYLAQSDPAALFHHVLFWVWIALFSLTLVLRRGAGDLGLTFILASFGFLFAAFVQGKGWPYHFLPAIGAMFAAVAVSARGAALSAPFSLFAGGAAALLAGLSVTGFMAGAGRVAIDHLLAPAPGLRVAALTADLALAHPFVRRIRGDYVQSVCSLWIASTALPRLRVEGLAEEERQRLEEAVAFEHKLLRDDLKRGQPHVILRYSEEFDWMEWARQDPETARELDHYRLWRETGGVMIWRRVAPVAHGPAS